MYMYMYMSMYMYMNIYGLFTDFAELMRCTIIRPTHIQVDLVVSLHMRKSDGATVLPSDGKSRALVIVAYHSRDVFVRLTVVRHVQLARTAVALQETRKL